jgi:hypothetical protein
MKRYVVSVAIAALVGASPAAADRGAPGQTFPEQPPSPAPGCAAVLSNPGTSLGGVAGTHFSDEADAITSGLLADACFGG